MIAKTDKKHLYWIIDLYLSDKITGKTFCDEYYDSSDLVLDYICLSGVEQRIFDELNAVPTFRYDDMNRLTGATKVHALASATTAEGVFPATPQAVTYTGFDKASVVKQGNDSISYAYGYDHQRISMKEELGGNIRIKDNLGSWTTITDEEGFVQQRLSYDAWGNLRDPDTWANYLPGANFKQPMFDRGYTGHEHLCDFGLINMNGRMYDPVVSSFLSVDQYVSSPENAQGFNRYAYCMNNPLRYVDPSGWRPIGGSSSGYFPNSSSNANNPYVCAGYGSARDIGNYAAGYVAGVHGISWESARLAFDALETMQKVGFWQTVRHYPNNRIIEGQPTQQAQYKGYTQGQYTYISRKRK